jgi:autotransporter-associated beta strand protein
MNLPSTIGSLRVCVAVAVLAAAASPASAANYTWKTLSGTGNWTDSVNWSGTSATNLYPGSVGSGTADGAFIQAVYTSPPTINLNTSVQIRQLNLGGTTGATTFPVTLSTNNGSVLTLSQTTTTGTAVIAVNSAVNSGTNLLAPDILMLTTVEARMASVTSGTVNLAIAGNVSAGNAGTRLFRYTPNNTSTTTDPSLLEFRGNITDGTSGGIVQILQRNDMPNSVNTMKLSGTGNTFSGGFTFSGGKPGQAILESSPASGTNGALGTGLLTLGASGSSAVLNLGGSLSTVTEVCRISVAGTVAKRIAVIGAGSRILSGTVSQTASAGLTLACSNAGDLTFSNAITGTGPITVDSTGAGKVIFAGAGSTFSGPTSVQAGGLQLASGSPLGTSTITPLAGGTLSLSPNATTTVGGLAPNAGGLTNVGNGYLTVAAGLTATDLVTAIVAGRNGGSWDGASGITSSAAAAAVASSVPRAVGWLDNGDGSVSAAYAAPGDTNIDWSIDILDASNFLSGGKFDAGLPATWVEGDFSYDGIVDILDAADFFATGLYDAGNYNTASGAVGSVAAVPEPSGLAALATAVASAALAVGWRRGARPAARD